MKIVVVANSLIFHQSYFWDEINKKENIELFYLSTYPLSEERAKMKYVDEKRDYLINSYEISEEEISKIFDGVDFVFLGNNYDKRVSKYIRNAPRLIVMAEHLSRRSSKLLNRLSLIKNIALSNTYKCKGERYLLAMSSYTFDDFKDFGFKNTSYRFGYFPSLDEIKDYPLENKDPYLIVWHGRFLELKHVEYAVETLRILKQLDSRYRLELIGEGEYLEKIKELVKSYNLEDSVTFMPFLAHDEIMKKLASASIYVFGSDKREGWGVALNEALASGSIVFVNETAGSARFLMENEKNGYLFSFLEELEKSIIDFSKKDEKEVLTMRNNAKDTIFNMWNHINASNRLYEMLISIYNHKDFAKFDSGPISKIK